VSVMQRVDALSTDRVQQLSHGLAAVVSGDVRAWTARTRYVGQGYELDVPFSPGEDGVAIAERFAARHELRYGFTLGRDVEVVAMRHTASAHAEAVRFARQGPRRWSDAERVDDGGPCDAVVEGEAVITLPDATLYVAAGWRARALAVGGWLVERAS